MERHGMGMKESTREFYENAYAREKLNAQRRWPNEEFCRFMGRNFFPKAGSERASTRILEAGCGAGANLRLLAEEGFDAYGIDLSREAVGLVPLLLGALEGKRCEAVCGNMMELPWPDGHFHAVVDVFSTYCLDEADFAVFANEACRVLAKGGIYFSYTPSKGSEAFRHYSPAKKTDGSTLDGIRRESSPFYGNFYPFRFMDAEDVRKYFDKGRFEVRYMEKVSRTYSHMGESFEFLVFEAEKR